MMRIKGYIGICIVCFFYWILDSIWSYLSFEYNLKNLIFSEPASYIDTFLLKVPPYQIVSRLMVVFLFVVLGSIVIEFILKKQAAEKEREASHDTLLTILNSIDATIYVSNMKSHEILFMNRLMIESFGGNFTGRICYEVLRNSAKVCEHCPIDQLVDESGNPKGVVIWEGKNPVTQSWYVNYDRAIRWIDGRIVHLQVATDITQLKALQEKHIKAEGQLRQAQKMESVGRLAGGVAHDYNNISSIIIGYSELALEKVAQSDPLYDDLTEILSAAKRSTEITKQLLAFARQKTTAPKVIDLNDNIEGMLKMLRRLIGEDIDLAWRPGAEVWPVKIDPSQIDQIMANLCVNARDAITDVGNVTIETKNIEFDEEYCADHAGFVPGEYVLLAVSDDGIGMAPKTLDKVFEPFFTTKGVGKGTGLGLATVYGIVKQNNGFINVYSELEKGTTIRIYLPRHSAQMPDAHRESPIEMPLSRGETLLIVEDDASILKLGIKILENLGYSVLSANAPGIAAGLAKEHADKIDLLITDVVMPEMNGRELSEQLKALYPDLKTLFMSGYTANVIAHRGVLDDGIDFIPKPFSKNDLAFKVREVLDRDRKMN